MEFMTLDRRSSVWARLYSSKATTRLLYTYTACLSQLQKRERKKFFWLHHHHHNHHHPNQLRSPRWAFVFSKYFSQFFLTLAFLLSAYHQNISGRVTKSSHCSFGHLARVWPQTSAATSRLDKITWTIFMIFPSNFSKLHYDSYIWFFKKKV